MEINKTLFWIDREWFDKEENCIVGDMGFTLCDTAETRTENYERLREEILEFAGMDMYQMGLDDKKIREEESVAIYLIIENEFFDEIDEEEDWSNSCAIEGDMDSRKYRFVAIYESEEEATRLGIVSQVKEWYPDAEIVFLNPDIEVEKYIKEIIEEIIEAE